jgi:hypothetical protein
VVLLLTSMAVIATQIQFDWLGGALATVMHEDPTAEGLDWTSLRHDLTERGMLPTGTVVGVLNWRDAGKIGYALGPGATTLCLCTDSRQFGFAHPLRDFAGQTLLLLVPDPAQHGIEEAKRWFRTREILPSASVRLDGRVLRTITVIRGEGLHP